MNLSRRSFFGGLATALVAAPAIIRTPGLLMPTKTLIQTRLDMYHDWKLVGEEFERYSIPYSQWRMLHSYTAILLETERNVL